jgi:hypothetical protein
MYTYKGRFHNTFDVGIKIFFELAKTFFLIFSSKHGGTFKLISPDFNFRVPNLF